MAYLSHEYLQFFIELAGNNNKDWFDLNRKRYESHVKIPFHNLVESAIAYFAKYDEKYKELAVSNCIFRINRDIRFSKDKTPYKLFCSAVIAPNGKKSEAVNGIYFECGPESVKVYGGIYEADKDQILSIREGIADNNKEFEAIIQSDDFQKIYGEIRGEKNKILPNHLKDAAANQDLIFNKQWYFMAEFPAEVCTQKDFIQLLDSCYQAGKPLENFFNQFIQRT